MAARKSCTHLTWGEAKSRSGQAVSGQKKNKEVLRKQDHGAVLAAKIIKKQGGDSKSAENKKLAKQFKKLELKAEERAAQRRAEVEEERLAKMEELRPYDRVQEKVAEKMEELRDQEFALKLESVGDAGVDLNDEDTQVKIAECKRMQLDEILALEAMIPETDFMIYESSRVETLRELLDKYEADDSDEAARSEIAQHPPITYLIKVEADDDRNLPDDPEMDLNVTILLQVTLPPLYLNSDGSQKPQWKIQYVMVSDKNAYCSADKALDSLAWLNEKDLFEGMNQNAEEELLPYPCVYGVAVTWLSENIFSFLTMQSHLLATK